MNESNILAQLEAVRKALKENRVTVIEPLELELNELSRALGVLRAGFAVGDTIINKNGKRAIVSHLYGYADTWGGNYKLLRKDGTESEFVRPIYGFDRWKKAEGIAA